MRQANPYDFYQNIRQSSLLIQGIAGATISRDQGYEFVQLGQFLERADKTTRILDTMTYLHEPANDTLRGLDSLQWVAILRSCSAYGAYRSTYGGEVLPDNVLNLLVFSAQFPRSVVETANRAPPSEKPLGIPFDALNGCQSSQECYDFLLPSHYVSTEPEIWREAVDARGADDDVFLTATRIMNKVYQSFRYDPDSTSSTTHMREAFAHKAGVCQDFAHVMIGMCRTLKIPARYVSGYIYSSDDHHLRGDQASHAWCEVYVPGHGWLGLDPTNNQPVDEQYVQVAWGRDYDDVAPVRGTYRGDTKRELTVHVKLTTTP